MLGVVAGRWSYNPPLNLKKNMPSLIDIVDIIPTSVHDDYCSHFIIVYKIYDTNLVFLSIFYSYVCIISLFL